ncbi:MAG TPA: diguanylate cyclase [Thermoanaerobaculia bacterium]|nr:diguanylate cyclase [Thermoanaerobaculia bacterium]
MRFPLPLRVLGTRALFVAWLCCLHALSALAATERGFPLITVYPPEVHKAGPQNFDIVQDAHGMLYVGNLQGLLTYDGAWWRLIKLPEDQAAIALAASHDGQLGIGLVNDFGTLVPGRNGAPQFRSLLPLLPQSAREFGDVRGVCAMDSGFLFVTEHNLLVWDGKNGVRVAATHTPTEGTRGCFSDAHEVYLRSPAGLHRFDPRTFAITPTPITHRVVLMLRHADGSLIAAVRDEGLFALRNGKAEPFAPEASKWIVGKAITGGCRLHDGRLVITSRQDGVLIVNADGSIGEIIQDKSGLPDAVLSGAFADREGSLWLSMEGPIVRVDVASPVSLFDARRGLPGSMADVVRHQGTLYAASSHGLFVFEESGFAHRVEGISEGVWTLASVDDELLVGTVKGVYTLRNGGKPQLAMKSDGEVYDMFRSRSDPSRVWLAERAGVTSMHRDAKGIWTPERMIPNSPQYLSSILEHDGTIWCGTVFDGVARIDDPTAAARVTRYDSGEMNVYEIGGRVVIVRAAGEVLSLDSHNHLIRDPLLGHLNAPRGFFVLIEDPRGNVWMNSTPPRVVVKTANGYAREGQPLVSVTASDIQAMRATDDGAIWFASDKGLFRYEPQAAPQVAAQPPPVIRRVVAGNEQVLFAGGIAGPATATLRHDFRRMRIEVAPMSYRPGVTYQYRLSPIDAGWSAWTEEPFIDFTTLEAGDYTFRIRARGPATEPSEPATWQFSVMPPWYRARWAYALWMLLTIAAIVLVIAVRTQRLQRQATRLRALVDAKTAELQQTVELLEQANERLEALSLADDLTNIANRRYFQRALADEWNRARRREQPLALILLDLDHFKDLNDRRGHPAGDEALRRVGRFLAETIRRSGEVVARYGGEEFAILLPGVETEDAVRVAEALREGIERLQIAYDASGHRRMTASCGVAAITPLPDLAVEDLVAHADRALYAAKHSGRNCVRLADGARSGTWLRDASA